MLRLTLRTLLAYLDDTLPPADARSIGAKLAESPQAIELVDRIKKVIRKRSLSTPPGGEEGASADPNVVAAYLSDKLTPEQVAEFEQIALESDVHLADVAACHQILTLLVSEQVRVPPTAYRRMYGLVKGRESVSRRKPGRAVPVGGAPADRKPADADDADAQYLLGLPAYSRSQPVGVRAIKWAMAVVLTAGVAVAAFLAWPKSPPAPKEPDNPLAANTPNPADTSGKTDTKPPDQPAPTDTKAVTPAVSPDKSSLPVTPPEKTDPKPMDPLVPAAEPPKEGRVAVGKVESADDRLLVVRAAGDDTWKRAAKGSEVAASDRLVCLPGYTARVKFDGGMVVDLWGNLPDLLMRTVLETAVTAHPPYPGFDADFTLHTGRVYLTTTNAKGAKVRVRFRDELWDLTLPDAKAEAVVEVSHAATPGPAAEPPVTTGVFAVRKGTAGLKVRYKDLPAVKAGESVEWDSVGGKLGGAIKVEPGQGRDAAYFNPTEVYPDAVASKAALTALSEFTDRARKAERFTAALGELRAEPKISPTLSTAEATAVLTAAGAAARFSVLASAALDEWGVLADALNDAARPELRPVALLALRQHLAAYPDREAAFRKLAAEKWRLGDADATTLLRHLRGLTLPEQTDPGTLAALVDMLSAKEVVQREVAYSLLVGWVDPPARGKKPRPFDPGRSPDSQQAEIAAWKKRTEEIVREKEAKEDAPK